MFSSILISLHFFYLTLVLSSPFLSCFFFLPSHLLSCFLLPYLCSLVLSFSPSVVPLGLSPLYFLLFFSLLILPLPCYLSSSSSLLSSFSSHFIPVFVTFPFLICLYLSLHLSLFASLLLYSSFFFTLLLLYYFPLLSHFILSPLLFHVLTLSSLPVDFSNFLLSSLSISFPFPCPFLCSSFLILSFTAVF